MSDFWFLQSKHIIIYTIFIVNLLKVCLLPALYTTELSNACLLVVWCAIPTDAGIQVRFMWQTITLVLSAARASITLQVLSLVSSCCGGDFCPISLQLSFIVGSQWQYSRITKPFSSFSKVKSST